MLGIVSEDENHNKIFKPMAGATLGQGVPLGTWCSFEKDVAPSNNWLMAGTTFDASVYPALNLYLGTNKVPSRYDHDRPSEWEDVASTNTFTPTYDGFMSVSYYNSGVIIKVNNVQIDIDNSPSNANGNMTLPFKKGDVITFFNVYDGSARALAFKVRYYKHPLFIKATSIASDTDQQAILAQIQAYNTYSTEETLTGKTWIDGKPIYRVVIKPTVSSTASDPRSIGTFNRTNVDRIISYQYTADESDRVVSNFYTNRDDGGDRKTSLYIASNGKLMFMNRRTVTDLIIIIEYTKTV